MKFKKSDYLHEDDSYVVLHDLDIGSIDHTGILVASLSALIIILIGVFSSDIDLISLYLSK